MRMDENCCMVDVQNVRDEIKFMMYARTDITRRSGLSKKCSA